MKQVDWQWSGGIFNADLMLGDKMGRVRIFCAGETRFLERKLCKEL
jgi:hypothetical protein